MKKLSIIALIISLSINLYCKASKTPDDTFNNQAANQRNGFLFNSAIGNTPEKCFSLICHQDQSILMTIKGEKIPLCPRCIGLHLGFIISCLVLTIGIKGRIKLSGKPSLFVLFAGLGMILTEWILGQFSIIQSGVLSRLFTGLEAGSIFGLLLVMYKREFTRRIITQRDSSGQLVIGPATIIALAGLSTTGGFLVMLIKSWKVIVFILFVTICMNFLIIAHTAFTRFLPFIQLQNLKNKNHEPQTSETC